MKIRLNCGRYHKKLNLKTQTRMSKIFEMTLLHLGISTFDIFNGAFSTLKKDRKIGTLYKC